MPLVKRCIAEFIGTFWLVFGGCGSAVLAAAFTLDRATLSNDVKYPLGIGLVGVSLAFGLTVLTMAYAIGHISGCHLNPAVSFGLATAKRFPWSEVLPYMGAQVVGAIVAAIVLRIIAGGNPSFSIDATQPAVFATNGYDAFSPGGFSLLACLVAEIVLSFVFLMIILGATDRRAPAGFAPLAIGLGLTLIHLISIPVTNTSVNPARSLGPALMVGGTPLAQVWLFWVAPIVGAVLAGICYYNVFEESPAERLPSETADIR
jgi:aquaporin Z